MALQNSAVLINVPNQLYLAVNNLVGPPLASLGGQGIFRSAAMILAQYISQGQGNWATL
jgi:hypothetical protein